MGDTILVISRNRKEKHNPLTLIAKWKVKLLLERNLFEEVIFQEDKGTVNLGSLRKQLMSPIEMKEFSEFHKRVSHIKSKVIFVIGCGYPEELTYYINALRELGKTPILLTQYIYKEPTLNCVSYNDVIYRYEDLDAIKRSNSFRKLINVEGIKI